jgi:hypothetical protein
MILESLFGLSLVLNVSLESPLETPAARNPLQMSVPQKEAALRPLMERSTHCIANEVVSDPRFQPDLRRDQLIELIADSFDPCGDPVNALVEAHDRMYGDGSGEAFLFGPYFNELPGAVLKRAKTRIRANSR